MKKSLISCLVLLMTISVFAQFDNKPNLQFNTPYYSNNRTVVLPADRIPSDFLGCTLGITTEVNALKNLNRLGIHFRESTGGASDVLIIDGAIECEGTKFGRVAFWFYNNTFWKIVFENIKTDSKVMANIIKQKYTKFSKATENYGYIRYRGSSADLVHNEYNLQYIIRGGSATR